MVGGCSWGQQVQRYCQRQKRALETVDPLLLLWFARDRHRPGFGLHFSNDLDIEYLCMCVFARVRWGWEGLLVSPVLLG